MTEEDDAALIKDRDICSEYLVTIREWLSGIEEMKRRY
jgi:hypothetical protein